MCFVAVGDAYLCNCHLCTKVHHCLPKLWYKQFFGISPLSELQAPLARPTTARQPYVFKPNTLKFCLTYSWLCLFRSLIKSGSGSLFLSLNFFQFQSILQLWRSSVQSHILDPIFLTRIPDWAERWFDSPHLSPIAAGWFAKMTCELRWQKAEKLKKLWALSLIVSRFNNWQTCDF